MDFYLGTVDRSDLEEKIGGLDRFVHTDLGIGWVKKLFVREEEEKEKGKVPWHPGMNMADFE